MAGETTYSGSTVFHASALNPELCVRAALPARARRKASASLAAAEAAPGDAPNCELYPVPCNLGVVAMDESTIELNFCADAEEHGADMSAEGQFTRDTIPLGVIRAVS